MIMVLLSIDQFDICKEFTGKETQRYVIRNKGDRVSDFATLDDATNEVHILLKSSDINNVLNYNSCISAINFDNLKDQTGSFVTFNKCNEIGIYLVKEVVTVNNNNVNIMCNELVIFNSCRDVMYKNDVCLYINRNANISLYTVSKKVAKSIIDFAKLIMNNKTNKLLQSLQNGR